MRMSEYTPQNKPYHCFIHLISHQESFPLRILRRLVFQSCHGPIEQSCASPRSMPNLRKGMPCAISWSPVLMKCFAELTSPPPRKAIISFSITHSGVSARLRGRQPLFADKWSSQSPPLPFFILGANGWYVVWLIGGESHIGCWRFTNANSKLLCIHYSQSVLAQ